MALLPASMPPNLKLALKVTAGLIVTGFLLLGIETGFTDKPPQTNRDYLTKIVNEHASTGIAEQMVADAKRNLPMIVFSDEQWKNAKEGLDLCLEAQEKVFLGSNDPYLDQIADEKSAGTFAIKFLKACNMLDDKKPD